MAPREENCTYWRDPKTGKLQSVLHDVVDLVTGEIVVDQGHLAGLKQQNAQENWSETFLNRSLAGESVDQEGKDQEDVDQTGVET